MDRRQAFAELVRRYQDLAYACAYAQLGNLSLAEEAAQEAFVTAWERLDQLRDPAAFPGWLRAIVRTQCGRLTRGGHLVLVPLAAAGETAAAAPDAQAALERREAGEELLDLIRALPEGERVVTLLHYLGGRDQAEIAAFLGLSPGAVAKRLFSARRRMKRQALDALSLRLDAARPSRDERFAERVAGRLRPSGEKDWVPVGALALLHHGEEDWLRERRGFDAGERIRRQYVAEHSGSGEILGYGCVEQTPYRPRYRMFLVADPRWLRDGVGDLLLDRLLADLRAVDAVTVALEEHAGREDLRDFLCGRGFAVTRRVWDLRLELDEARDTTPVLPAGVRLSTLAAERAADPSCLEKLHELAGRVAEDPVRPPAFHAPEAALWVDRPCVLPDGHFIAVDGERYVGACDVHVCGAAPEQVRRGFTGVVPERRRQGIATALERAAIAFARARGFRGIRASAGPGQAAILALSEKLGYVRRASSVTLERCLRDVVRVDPAVYDGYVGRYRGDRRELVVTKEDGRLFAELIGQKVELFPESERAFFVKWFYGRAEFDRAPGDDAPRLTWRQGKEVILCARRSA
jgi:RNA polymerase sigma factor (sigma-70 family)